MNIELLKLLERLVWLPGCSLFSRNIKKVTYSHKLLIPDSMKLVKGCGCGRNMTPDSFHIEDDTGSILKSFKFFEDEIEPDKHFTEKMLDDMESTLDK